MSDLKINCVCGSNIFQKNYERHIKSKKHKKYEEKIRQTKEFMKTYRQTSKLKYMHLN